MTATESTGALPTAAQLRRRLSGLTTADAHRLRRRIERQRRRGWAPRSVAELVAELDRAEVVRAERAALVGAVTYPDELPLTGALDELRAAIEANQVVLVAGETGSGKSTQLPKLCLEMGRGVVGMIGHTQPRRVAARSVAARIGAELGWSDEAVAASVRFDDRAGPRTLVRVMTDGILCNEVHRDPLLRRYDTIIIDEAHERSLNIDLLFGVLTRVLPRRRDLKAIITSATVDTERIAAHFRAPVVTVAGRGHPVEIRHREPEPDADSASAVVEAVTEILTETPATPEAGDVLVFCSGEREIAETIEALEPLAAEAELELVALHGRLPPSAQQRVFTPGEQRRIIVATNVAETSLTVPRIGYVVDTGTARISRYHPRRRIQRLPVEPISQASAAQRAGRCGRLAPGVCLRLYSAEDFEARPAHTEPELVRTNLAAVVLRLADLGVAAAADFPFIDRPDPRLVAEAESTLVALGALDTEPGPLPGRLTPIGRRLARLGVDPRLGRMVLEAERFGCVAEVAAVVAGLSVRDPRTSSEEPSDESSVARADRQSAPRSDLLDLVARWRTVESLPARGGAFRRACAEAGLHPGRVREWQDLYRQLTRTLGRLGIEISSNEEPAAVHRSVLAGALDQVGVWDARRRRYRGTRGTSFVLHRASAVGRPRWVVALELVDTGGRLVGRMAAPVRPAWIEEAAGDLVEVEHGEPWWDPEAATALVEERVRLFGLTLVPRRRRRLERFDPVRARHWFIVHALAAGQWDRRPEWVDTNRELVAEMVRLAQRSRRPELSIDERALIPFYESRWGPAASGAAAAGWWRRHRSAPLLATPADLGLDLATLDLSAFPDTWAVGEHRLALDYDWHTGSQSDGVTLVVPLPLLELLDPVALEWNVPGLRAELFTELLRSQPKEVRRQLVPIGQRAEVWADELEPRGAVRDALVRAAAEIGVELDGEVLAATRPSEHLRMRVAVSDAQGRRLDADRDLAALQTRRVLDMGQALDHFAGSWSRSGLTDWPSGLTLVDEVSVDAYGTRLSAHPTLVDEGDSVGVTLVPDRDRARHRHRAGLIRLGALAVGGAARTLTESLDDRAKLELAGRLGAELGSRLAELVEAAVADAVDAWPEPVGDEAAWRDVRRHLASTVVARAADHLDTMVGLVETARALADRLAGLELAEPVAADIERQLDRLAGPGALARAGLGRFDDLGRYLAALDLRLDRARGRTDEELDRIRVLQALEMRVDALAARRGDAAGDAVETLRWRLEELRVSVWAQQLGTTGKVSVVRLDRELTALGA